MFGIILLLSVPSVDIVSPVDGQTYETENLELKAYVGDSVPPDSVWYILNSICQDTISRVITDWYTYCQNDTHTGYSRSPVPEDSTILWKVDSIVGPHSFCTPTIVDGIVYWASGSLGSGYDEGNLYALRASTGEEVWRIDSIGSVDDAVTYKYGRIYCLSEKGIWCVDAKTGSVYWSKPEGGHTTTPAVGNGKVYYITSTYPPFVCCRDAFTGEQIWMDAIFDYYTTENTITLWNDMLYCPFSASIPIQHGKLICFDAVTGDVKWEKVTDTLRFWDSAPLIADSTLYIGAAYGMLLAVDPFTGEIIWRKAVDPGPYAKTVEATPTYHDGRVFIGGFDFMNCLDAKSGDDIWKFPIYRVHNTNVIADSCVIFVDANFWPERRFLYVVNEYTGELIWKKCFPYPDYTCATAPSIADGVIYLPIEDGNFYAFGTGLKYTYINEISTTEDTNKLVVFAKDSLGNIASDTIEFYVDLQGIDEEEVSVSDFAIYPISPNPFRYKTTIEYAIPEETVVKLKVYDVSGREIRTLVSGLKRPGVYTVTWDGMNSKGEILPSGIYFGRLESPSSYATAKLVKIY